MIKNFIKKRIALFFPLILVIIGGILAWKNFTPGTWLSGWDTLHPEFDFSLNFQRILSVWHEEQGLGTLTGHSQVAELPRMIFLWLTSLVFPVSFLRYLYFFTCLILGPLGMYFFLEKIAFVAKEGTKCRILSFLGGLFYLLNLGTVQHFFVPFEMFATLYAFLPWILLFADRFIKIGRKKDLILFCFLSFLSASMAYAATLWYAFFAFFSLYILMTTLLENRSKIYFKRVLVLFLTILSINSFWLLPNLYYLSSSAKSVPQAKINQIFSERAFSTDEKYATPENVFLLKGFLFDWWKYNKGEFAPLLAEWKNHINKSEVRAIGWIIVITTLIGIFTSCFSKKEKLGIILLPGLIFSFIFLIYGAPILKNIFLVLRERSDIFKEGLRFPWTKFSIFVMFSFAVYFSLGIEKIAGLWRKHEIKVLVIFCLPFFTALIIVWTLPAFKGNLISPLMRIKIPQDYFDLFSYFKNKPKNERIALFPASSFLGWEYYRWGFEGAGFIWFGLPQPVLTRDFDRWHPANENFYWEVCFAIYAKNGELFENVLQKYQVKWLLFDESKVDPAWPMSASSITEFQKLISESGDINLEQTFGKIKIYKVNLETEIEDFVYLVEDLPTINGYKWGNLDVGFEEFGEYMSISNDQTNTKYQIQNTKYDTYYPFRSLFTGRKTDELDIEIEDLGDRFVFRKQLPNGLEKYKLAVPPYGGNELVEVDKTDLTKVKYFIPTVSVVGNVVEVVVPKVGGLFSAEIDPTKMEEVLKAENCNQLGNGEVRNGNGLWDVGCGSGMSCEGEEKMILRLYAKDANNCSASFWLPELPHKYGYLISAETKNISGKPLLFWVENLTNRKADMEVYLSQNANLKSPACNRLAMSGRQNQNLKLKTEKGDDYTKYKIPDTEYLIQPPMAQDGLGYTLHFDNISIGREKTVNELGKISVHPIPYKFLTSLKLINQGSRFNDLNHFNETAGGVNVFNLEGVIASHMEVNHPNPAAYEVKVKEPIAENTTLVLSQAFHEGWKAYEVSSIKYSVFREFFAPILGKEIKEHVVVNNWGNGWMLQDNRMTGISEQSRTIVLVFWPQYLEYAGFGLMGIAIVISLYRYIVNKKTS